MEQTKQKLVILSNRKNYGQHAFRVLAPNENSMKHRISIHAMYYKIAADSETEYWSLDTELRRLGKTPIGEDEIEANQQAQMVAYANRQRSAVVAITFAAMSLEAFFFDYLADVFGDIFVNKHMAKLDLKSRFIVYPKMVIGKSPNKGTQAYERVSTLQSTRNKLVHFKSRSFDLANLSEASDYHSNLNNKLKKGVESSTESVRSVMKELDDLHEGKTMFLRRLEWSIES